METHLERNFRIISIWLSIGAAMVGFSVLLGWIFDIQLLKSIYPDWVSMKANAAIGIIFAGIILVLLNREKEKTKKNYKIILANVLSVVILILGVIPYFEYVFHFNAGIDEIFFSEELPAIGTSYAGRMAPSTSVGFILFGLSFLLINKRIGSYSIFQFTSFIAGLFGFASLLEFILEKRIFTGAMHFNGMAFQTACSFLMLMLAVFFCRPSEGVMKVISANNSGGRLSRMLFPVAISILIISGWLHVIGERTGFISKEGSIIYLILFLVLVACIIILTSAKSFSKSEEELLKLHKAVYASGEIIFITDINGVFKFVNRAFTDIYGYTSEELVGKSTPRILKSGLMDGNTYKQFWNTILGKHEIRSEITNKKKDGSFIDVQVSVNPILDKNESIIGFVGVQRDITERKKAEEKIVASNKELKKINSELDHFVYSTSHDLRSPLTSVLGLVGFIEEETKESDTLEHARMIHARVKRLDDYILNILNYSRNNRLEVVPVQINLRKLIAETVAGLQHMYQANKIHFEIIEDTSTPFYSDLQRINSIVENLIGNAIKYYDPAKAEPQVSVTIKTSAKEAEIIIADNGIGIGENEQLKIFDMFYRISGAIPGSGLGLYLVREIVDKLEGTISVKSAIGKGTKFCVTLKNLKDGNGN